MSGIARLRQATVRAAAGAVVVACAGCAAVGAYDPPPQRPGTVRTPEGRTLAPQAALDAVTPGRSRQAEVAAALGPAIVVRFDSGHAVWVYRWVGPDRTIRGASELVLLFDPDGLLAKARLRSGYPPLPRNG